MKEFHKKLNKIVEDVKSVSLNVDEKNKIRDFLKYHMKENPIIEISPNIKPDQNLISKFFPNFQKILGNHMKLAGVALVTLLVFSGSVYASQNSLPGDVLYPAKILSEKIRGSLAWSEEKKAEVAAEIALTRLEETEELKKIDRLDNKTKTKLQTSFVESSKYSLDVIEDFQKKSEEKSDDVEKISDTFKEKLGAHKEHILSLSVDNPETNDEAKISSSVDKVLNRIVNLKNERKNDTKDRESNKENFSKAKSNKNIKSSERLKSQIRPEEFFRSSSSTNSSLDASSTTSIKSEAETNINSNSESNSPTSGTQNKNGSFNIPVEVNQPIVNTNGVIPGL